MSGIACGADGCPAGWLAITLPSGDPATAEARIVGRVLDLVGPNVTVAIDMPVGLMDSPQDGMRPPDIAARKFLGAKNFDGLKSVSSRVFSSPTRQHLDLFRGGLSFPEINGRFSKGSRISQQCFAICEKISELDIYLQRQPEASVWEVHPEVCFAFHSGKTLKSKKSSAGRKQRHNLLVGIGFDLFRLSNSLGARGKRWAVDDLYDACIASVTAARIMHEYHFGLPNLTERDSKGIRRTIVF